MAGSENSRDLRPINPGLVNWNRYWIRIGIWGLLWLHRLLRHESQVGHGFLGLPHRTGFQNCKARREGPPAHSVWQFGGCRGSGPRGHPRCRGGGRVRCAPRNRAKGRAGRHARGTGEGCSGGSRRACDVRRGQNGPCTSHCVVARCCAAGLGLCRSATSAGVRRGGAPRWPRRLSVFQLSVFKTPHTHPPTHTPPTHIWANGPPTIRNIRNAWQWQLT